MPHKRSFFTTTIILFCKTSKMISNIIVNLNKLIYIHLHTYLGISMQFLKSYIATAYYVFLPFFCRYHGFAKVTSLSWPMGPQCSLLMKESWLVVEAVDDLIFDLIDFTNDPHHKNETLFFIAMAIPVLIIVAAAQWRNCGNSFLQKLRQTNLFTFSYVRRNCQIGGQFLILSIHRNWFHVNSGQQKSLECPYCERVASMQPLADFGFRCGNTELMFADLQVLHQFGKTTYVSVTHY